MCAGITHVNAVAPMTTTAGTRAMSASQQCRAVNIAFSEGHTWALRSRPPVEPPKMGDGVLGSRVGAVQAGLASFAGASAASARTTIRAARGAGACLRDTKVALARIEVAMAAICEVGCLGRQW